MEQLTCKELEYAIDSMSNEDLLLKQATLVVSQSTHPELTSCCQEIIQNHRNSYKTLLNAIEQHQTIAPQTLN